MSQSITDWAGAEASRSLMLNQLMQLIDLFADKSPNQEVLFDQLHNCFSVIDTDPSQPFDQLRNYVSGEWHWHHVCNLGAGGLVDASTAKENGDTLAEVYYRFIGVVSMALHNFYVYDLDEEKLECLLKLKDEIPFRGNPKYAYWIMPCALDLADHLDIDQSKVIRIVAGSPDIGF